MLFFHYVVSTFIMLPIDTIISIVYHSTDYEGLLVNQLLCVSVCAAIIPLPETLTDLQGTWLQNCEGENRYPQVLVHFLALLKCSLCYPWPEIWEENRFCNLEERVKVPGAAPVSPRWKPLLDSGKSPKISRALWGSISSPQTQLSFLPYLSPGASKS